MTDQLLSLAREVGAILRSCSCCGETKPLDAQHYRYDQRREGFVSKCRACCNRRATELRATPAAKATMAKYRLENRAKYNDANREWRIRNRKLLNEKQRLVRAERRKQNLARAAVTRALRHGKLVRQPCQACGFSPAVAHHPDYDAPLDVVWLCARHHAEVHAMTPIRSSGTSGSKSDE